MAGKKRIPKQKALSRATKHLARCIAKFYRRQVRLKNSYAQPWRLDLPLEELKVFSYFVTVVRIVTSMKADYRDFVRAQFECWNGPRLTYPVPSQLVSDGAMDRYNRWLCKNRPTIKKSVISKEQKQSAYDREQRQLSRLCSVLELPESEVLVQECSEFSASFLRHRGVWELCAQAWKAAHSD